MVALDCFNINFDETDSDRFRLPHDQCNKRWYRPMWYDDNMGKSDSLLKQTKLLFTIEMYPSKVSL